MTVLVIYRQRGERKEEPFDSEARASIFMDGLRARDNCRFERIKYPDEAMPDPPARGRKPRL